MWGFAVFLATCLGVSHALDIFYMEDYCGTEIDMEFTDEYIGKLSVDDSFTGDCNVTIKALSQNRLGFYFEEFDLGMWQLDCQSTFLTAYNGQSPKYSPEMHGLYKKCGSSKPQGHYATNSRYVTFRYFNSDASNNNRLDIIFTMFHRGYCYSYEYECSNGRCIDDTINCIGYDTCGDGSDCKISAATIVGIVLGSLFGVCVLSAFVVIIVKNKRKQKSQIRRGYASGPTGTIAAPSYEVSPTTFIRAASPPPNYGMAQQYSTTTTYTTPTSIQGDK